MADQDRCRYNYRPWASDVASVTSPRTYTTTHTGFGHTCILAVHVLNYGPHLCWLGLFLQDGEVRSM
ncbi:hypothetical protein I79_024296 [Cricetulus griseus]|uniref:Uncharacterized protein n=1 Tax=Cricetulus griseus TaxID=10029 RepID=G3IK99_CRIGR|nr:hypothetical protein I79_024296 [Cricetulus griseus]